MSQGTPQQTPPDDLLAWREEFPITTRTSYLISNSLGAMPRRARERVGAFLDGWDRLGVRAWAEGWWVAQDEFGGLVERILGVDRGTVSMHQNVAMAMQAILSCFRFDGPRNRIVLTDLDFPSVMYLYEAQRQIGAEIVRVPAADERTLLVPLNHVLFRSAAIQDVAAVVRRARDVGAFVVLDAFQSVGALPLALRDVGVHAAVGGALKYLCGGPGNCFLYVHPDERRALSPRFTGWAADRDPFAFDPSGIHFRDDGGKFRNGTPNVPALYSGIEGVRIVAEIGGERIRAKSRRLTAAIVAAADRLGLPIASPRAPELRGGHVTIAVPDGYAVCQTLLAEDIVVDFRPNAGLRIAPHFYSTEAECIAAVERIAAILAGREHARFLDVARKPG
jgi:kynureninase